MSNIESKINSFKAKNIDWMELTDERDTLLNDSKREESYIFRLENDRGERILLGKRLKQLVHDEAGSKREKENFKKLLEWLKEKGYVDKDFTMEV